MSNANALGKNSQPLVVERTFDAPVSAVWHAISNKDAMSQWSFKFDDFQPKVGFKFTFNGTHEGATFVHRCVVTEVIPEKRLSYSWRYEGYEGDSLVTIELFDEGGRTRLKLTHAGLDTFPKTESFDRKNFEMGWNSLIGDLLKKFLEGNS